MELIVVLLILAILLALLIPSLISYITSAQKKACLVSKAGLLRDLTADEIYELEGSGKYDTAYLKSLAEKSEYKCRQGGPMMSAADLTEASSLCAANMIKITILT